MVLRFAPGVREISAEPRAAVDVFMDSQKDGQSPCGVVTQLAHSDLAGQLARQLRGDAFGELPPEVAQAAEFHDRGWKASDDRQLARFPDHLPEPFPRVPEDEVPSWRRSLELADTCPPLTRCLISRHFSALAQRPTPQHEMFLATETSVRTEIENLRGFRNEDLERWAGAVGFCDIVSLYLSSGLRDTVTFPLTHPAYEYAAGVPHVTLSWRNETVVFSAPVLEPEANVRFEVLALDETRRSWRPQTIDVNLRSGVAAPSGRS